MDLYDVTFDAHSNVRSYLCEKQWDELNAKLDLIISLLQSQGVSKADREQTGSGENRCEGCGQPFTLVRTFCGYCNDKARAEMPKLSENEEAQGRGEKTTRPQDD